MITCLIIIDKILLKQYIFNKIIKIIYYYVIIICLLTKMLRFRIGRYIEIGRFVEKFEEEIPQLERNLV